MNPKQAASEKAATYAQDGMVVGLGTGSTAAYAITAIAGRVRKEGLRLRCVATSAASEELARNNGLHVAKWDRISRFDITIDGADEVDPEYRMIKGGGGALLREKIVASSTDREIIVVDQSKLKPHLGAFPLPVVVVPFGWQRTRDRLEATFGCEITPREAVNGEPLVTDDSLQILDLHFNGPLPDVETLEARLKTIPGVVECGLFIGMCQHVIVGRLDGTTVEYRCGDPFDISE